MRAGHCRLHCSTVLSQGSTIHISYICHSKCYSALIGVLHESVAISRLSSSKLILTTPAALNEWQRRRTLGTSNCNGCKQLTLTRPHQPANLP